MQPSFAHRIRTMNKALAEVVLPAVDPDNKAALEQLQLVMGSLALMDEQIDHGHWFEVADGQLMCDMAARIAETAGQDPDESVVAAIAAFESVSQRSDARLSDIRQANIELREALFESSRDLLAGADADTAAAISRLIVEMTGEQVSRERAYVAKCGFDVFPDSLKSIPESLPGGDENDDRPSASELVRREPTDAWIAELREAYPTEPSIDAALTRKLERRGKSSYQAVPTGDIGERLHRLIAERTDGDIAIRNLRSLTGGASKEQFLFELDWTEHGERRTGDRFVLRCEPPASIVETDRAREFELMQFGGKLMPVPRVPWVDVDGSVMGTPSLVSSFVTGVQKPSKVASNVSGMGTHFARPLRDRLVPQYAQYMAALHRAEIGSDELPSFSRPAVGTTQASMEIVNWWARCWQEDLYEQSMVALATEDWLRRNAPELDTLSVVHGDFRTGNFLFDEESATITAILDWELGYLGDRHGDLGWVLTDLYRTYEDGKPFHCGLFESEDALVEAYEAAGGLKIDRRKLAWHKLFCTWKQLILSLGCALRAAEGLTHQDVLLSWLSTGGYTISESLRRQLDAA